jgi:CheY-like chemotaxis protein
MTRPRVLCVDDDVNLLEGMSLNLRRHFEVRTATSGQAGLDALATQGPFQVVLSDMRMPSMDGTKFLTQVREKWPHISRILLTGQADIESAIAAVNRGQVFRFLTKPCPAPDLKATIDAAVEHHRLITAEKELIGKTLKGSLQALMDVLAISSPEAFGQASRIKRRLAFLGQRMKMPMGWEWDMAALLYHIGYVSVTPELAAKVQTTSELSAEERQGLDAVPKMACKILSHIPRLEPVIAILKELTRLREGGNPFKAEMPETIPVHVKPAWLLHWVMEVDALQKQGFTVVNLLPKLQKGRLKPEAELVEAIQAWLLEDEKAQLVDLGLAELEVGMILAEDIKTGQGTLLVASGFEITEGLLERLKHLSAAHLPDQFKIRMQRIAQEVAS